MITDVAQLGVKSLGSSAEAKNKVATSIRSVEGRDGHFRDQSVPERRWT
jgi:hypothetical protein